MGLFPRALLAFLALPGLVAFALPAAWAAWRHGFVVVHPSGWLLLTAGLCGLLACVRDFYVAGKGTLAPWAPPQALVVVGLYRRSRNPMYVCVLLILAGWAWTFASLPLGLYAAAVGLAFHLRVRFGEEPWLARRYGAQWEHYRSRVRRWL